MAKNDRFLKLLGLAKGCFALDGCAVGYPAKYPECRREFELEKYITWVE